MIFIPIFKLSDPLVDMDFEICILHTLKMFSSLTAEKKARDLAYSFYPPALIP